MNNLYCTDCIVRWYKNVFRESLKMVNVDVGFAVIGQSLFITAVGSETYINIQLIVVQKLTKKES